MARGGGKKKKRGTAKGASRVTASAQTVSAQTAAAQPAPRAAAPASSTSGTQAGARSDGPVRLGKTFLSPDLMQAFSADRSKMVMLDGVAQPSVFAVILEMNVDFPGGAQAGRALVLQAIGEDAGALGGLTVFGLDAQRLREAQLFDEALMGVLPPASIALAANEHIALAKSLLTDRYLFATLTQAHIEGLARLSVSFSRDDSAKRIRLLYKAWLDRDVETFVYKSSKTIKADAASVAFAAHGEGVVWAVADTGIDADHPHFRTHKTLSLPDGLRHLDFTDPDLSFDADMDAALQDAPGHGTHVAGIIAGECTLGEGLEKSLLEREVRHGEGQFETVVEDGPARIAGVAPLCKLMSLRVLDDEKRGKTSTLIAAIGYLLRVNDYGHKIRVHGLNLSVGYEFEAEWFAAGRSPLCNEVDRLVRSGVVVVVAAGNAGFGRVNNATGAQEQASFAGTIADPGNAELAITVGSTHRDMPHAYGVSYFSSKGPTADGRAKPDLIAPGERIISCAANSNQPKSIALFREESGTSMAAPHVSGAIAAFLSIRSEFVGRPGAVKELFLSTATDLKRMPHYQGRGLIDLMRAIQAV